MDGRKLMVKENLVILTRTLRKSNDIIKQNTTIHHEKLDDVMSKIGFSFIHEGIDRAAYTSKDNKFVVKIQICNCPEPQNKLEIENWLKLPKEVKKYFLKPLVYDKEFRWIIYRKAKVSADSSLSFKKIAKIRKELECILENFHLSHGDLHNSNIGELDGKPIIIDYAFLDGL